ncbi:MAG TPA: chemotaxis protein CheW [Candidatus Acidoferrales bacterium]|nr:chemotaxis protein CheW [Candidatus Acidoferrales bacterium]
MSVTAELQLRSFVLLPLDNRKVALPAESVIELVAQGRLQKFPNQTPWITGVIIRRGRVVPVCDVSQLFGEGSPMPGRFYLVAEWKIGKVRDWCAIPVVQECELANAESYSPIDASAETRAAHVVGTLRAGEEEIEVLDMGKLIAEFQRNTTTIGTEPAP